jgi:hypothetical protein
MSKHCIDASINHKDVVREAQVHYPLTTKADALVLRWMYFGEYLKKKSPGEAYYERLRFKLLCLFVVAEERIN